LSILVAGPRASSSSCAVPFHSRVTNA
jgi:hypothetical protein